MKCNGTAPSICCIQHLRRNEDTGSHDSYLRTSTDRHSLATILDRPSDINRQPLRLHFSVRRRLLCTQAVCLRHGIPNCIHDDVGSSQSSPGCAPRHFEAGRGVVFRHASIRITQFLAAMVYHSPVVAAYSGCNARLHLRALGKV